MSYKNFKEALELAKELPDYKVYDTCSDKAMDELEDYLGFELSKQHYEFLKMGALEVWGYEFSENNKNSHDLHPDIIFDFEWNKKNKFIIDKGYVPILEEDEWTNYLNYNKLTKEGEPTVVYAFPSPEEFIIFEQTNQDLGDFLLKLFNEIKKDLDEDE